MSLFPGRPIREVVNLEHIRGQGLDSFLSDIKRREGKRTRYLDGGQKVSLKGKLLDTSVALAQELINYGYMFENAIKKLEFAKMREEESE